MGFLNRLSLRFSSYAVWSFCSLSRPPKALHGIELLSRLNDIADGVNNRLDEPSQSWLMSWSPFSSFFVLAGTSTRRADIYCGTRLLDSETVDHVYPRTLNDGEVVVTKLPAFLTSAWFASVF